MHFTGSAVCFICCFLWDFFFVFRRIITFFFLFFYIFEHRLVCWMFMFSVKLLIYISHIVVCLLFLVNNVGYFFSQDVLIKLEKKY